MPKTKVKCGHKSFWWLTFKEFGISMQVLSVAIGVDQERLEHFLTGQSMPPRNIAVKLCNQLIVPESKGFKEFRKAHKAWKISHPIVNISALPELTETSKSATYIFELPKLLDGRSNNKGRPKKKIELQTNAPVIFDEDLELIYSKVSYNTYMKFRKGKITLKDILPELYSKIDLTTYLKIYKS